MEYDMTLHNTIEELTNQLAIEKVTKQLAIGELKTQLAQIQKELEETKKELKETRKEMALWAEHGEKLTERVKTIQTFLEKNHKQKPSQPFDPYTAL